MEIKKDLSIVLGTHNRMESLKKLIEISCASANGCDYEIIVNDASSTDGTVDWLKEICKKNNRIIPIFGKKEGITKAYNECFERSVGKFIIWLSDDMIPLDKALFNMFKFMSNKPENVMGAFQTRNSQDLEFRVPGSIQYLVPDVGCVYNNYFKQSGFWNTDYPYYGQDSEWNARVYRMGGIILPTQEKIDHLNLQDNLKSENIEGYKNDGFFDKYRLFYSRNYGRKSEWKYPAIYFNLQQGYSPKVIERVMRGFNIFYKNIVFVIPEKQELIDPHNCVIFCPKSEATSSRFDLIVDISPRGVKILDNSGTHIQSEFLNQIIRGKKNGQLV